MMYGVLFLLALIGLWLGYHFVVGFVREVRGPQLRVFRGDDDRTHDD